MSKPLTSNSYQKLADEWIKSVSRFLKTMKNLVVLKLLWHMSWLALLLSSAG
jgi:hypothetical protein